MGVDGGGRFAGWPTGRARLARWGKNAKTAGSVIGPEVQSQPKSDSKNVILNNVARPLTVSALLAALALTACSAPEAGNTPSSRQSRAVVRDREPQQILRPLG